MHFYNVAFDCRSLEKELLETDYKSNPNLKNDAYRKGLLHVAQLHAESGFGHLSLMANPQRHCVLYGCRQLAQEIVIRRLGRNIRRLIRRRASDRETIIKSLRALFTDGHAFRVYKLDIKNFYEKIDTRQITAMLVKEPALSAASMKVFKAFADQLIAQNVAGLPRGMSISATLSEYLMQDVDAAIKAESSVYFYARYVDDIIVVTTGNEKREVLFRKLQRLLPNGLEFNRGKSRVVDFTRPPVNRRANATLENTVDFLGYRFSIFGQAKEHNTVLRKVTLDISAKKIKRLKTRICLALLQFAKDGKYPDLRDRIFLIAQNYNLYDTNKKIRRNVGLYWNYRFIDLGESRSLPDLDSFLKKLLLSRHGKVASTVNHKLLDKDKAHLLSISFSESFRKKTFRHFNSIRLAELARCWAYE